MKKITGKHLFFILLITCNYHLFAQNFTAKYLGIEQGLSNNSVQSIYQDYNGFMWVGTYDGLNRYDGYSFKVIRNVIGDSTSLTSNSIFTMEGDIQHNIWVGGLKGINIFDPVTANFSKVKYRELNKNKEEYLVDNIHMIKAVKDGHMFAATQHRGIIVFEKDSTTGLQVPIINGQNEEANYDVTAIEIDEQRQCLWVFIQQYGLYIYDLKKQRLQIVSDYFTQGNCLQLNKQGNVWLGSDNGLFEYNVATKNLSGNLMPLKSKIVNLCKDRQDALWIASDGEGAWTLLPGADKAAPLTSATGKSITGSNAVFYIYEDFDGRKWIGTLRGGISMVESKRSPFQIITYNPAGKNNAVDNFILSFCEDENNNVWIGTDGAGLRYWDRKKNTLSEYRHNPADKTSISSNFITSIIKDAKNDIWVSTWLGGVGRLKKNSQSFENFTCFNPTTREVENKVWRMFEDTKKNIWASTTNDGSLYLFDRKANEFQIFDASIKNLQSIAEDNEGNFWGGNYTSLIKIDRSEKKHQTYPIGYPVRCIHEDANKNFWVGTQDGGLLLFSRTTGTFERFTTTDGLPGNTILRMLEDKKGNLWLSTYNGLSKFSPKRKALRNFSQSDGLQSNQFSFNAALALQSGEFMFGGIRGFNIFYPDSVGAQADLPHVFLNGLRINNNQVEADNKYITERTLEKINKITLPYDEAVLSIDFLALDYSGADKIKYAYYLDNWDKGWNYVNNMRTANYSRLQEGSYFFKIKITNPDGKWSSDTTLLHIIVLPPWYRSWWAYLLYIILFSGAIYFYVRYTRRQDRLKYEIRLAHLENEKDKEITEKKLSFFTNISHEFRTPLTLIINPLKESISNNSGQQGNFNLNTAYRNARRLLSLVDQLLLFRKAGSGEDILKISRVNIIDLCNEVYQCFIQQAKTKQIEYKIQLPPEPVEIYADHEKIEIALFNLLSNAFKFTSDKGSIVFEVTDNAEDVIISVKDNGCGIEGEETKKIYEKFQQGTIPGAVQKTGFGIGLYLVKHFVDIHKGSVKCESVVNSGTTFTITLKKGNAHLPFNYQVEDTGKKYNILAELSGEQEDPPPKQDLNIIKQSGKKAEEVVTGRKSILLIDDSAEIIKYLHHIFEQNYLLYEADNGIEGLRLAELHLPDLIISDINMEGLDGVELCHRVKKSEALGHIPVILLTSATSVDIKLRGIEEGADDYITKPFDKEILLARVESILRDRKVLQKYFFDNITLKKTTVKVPAEFQEFLQKCITVVEDNIDTEDFTIKKFSKAMGMSHSGLYQKIKSISGQSLNAFIRSIRLRRAAVLMLTEGMNINQAAFQVGINDVRYFREQFVKLFDMTPSDYIKKYRHSFNRDFNIIREE
ncbi:MAG: two-component regulator propeller domain-containing protein [Ferruginibacter sp.]